ncbi:MAG: hypothetical protein ACEPOZ_21305 [Marinifilaceae bacterium]
MNKSIGSRTEICTRRQNQERNSKPPSPPSALPSLKGPKQTAPTLQLYASSHLQWPGTTSTTAHPLPASPHPLATSGERDSLSRSPELITDCLRSLSTEVAKEASNSNYAIENPLPTKINFVSLFGKLVSSIANPFFPTRSFISLTANESETTASFTLLTASKSATTPHSTLLTASKSATTTSSTLLTATNYTTTANLSLPTANHTALTAHPTPLTANDSARTVSFTWLTVSKSETTVSHKLATAKFRETKHKNQRKQFRSQYPSYCQLREPAISSSTINGSTLKN